jgi:ATP-dependent helicase/nuclease subunit A
MTLHDPQRRAADPNLSAFVTANAGSGKTKTLIDRVARLLLEGAPPAAILCVTYTKAASTEMQRRLFGLLGRWSVSPDDELKKELAELEGRPVEGYGRDLSRARKLFALALETPGGLKIQTIHAFCEKLLRRFPLEAGVSPGFRVMDDAASAAIAAAARKAVARYALKGEGLVAQAYARFSVALDFASFQSMFQAFEDQRGKLREYLDRHGGLEGAVADVWGVCGFPEGTRHPEDLEAEIMAALDRRAWRDCAEVLSGGGKTDQKSAELIRAACLETAGLAECLAALFTEKGEGTPVAWVAKTSGLKAREDLRSFLVSEQDRLERAREQIRAANVALDTQYALVLANAYLQAYAIEKASSGALDFADLIEKTWKLVEHTPAAAWVLYKLDGGIDHILVDEAQDTAPEQWGILRSLTAEFFSGAGATLQRRTLERNLFVVGDEKQSIYSFQGARPELLIGEFEFHRERATGAGFEFERVDLLDSWRSTPQVLSFVDACFAPPELARAILPRAEAESIVHKPRRLSDAGCVDLWPLVREEPSEQRQAWDAPLDEEGEGSANKRLAGKIADEIAALIARGDAVWDRELGWRPAKAGDVLILVRRRKALFEEILRALKHRHIPVAGADRLALSEHIVFDDLMAVARFVQFPQDELNLAALLKSPFCGLDDQGLYALAKGRGKANLWDVLQARAQEQEGWRAAHAVLKGMVDGAARPFEFYSRLLNARDGDGRSMRQRILRRLGSEAEDALDEFLAQVLAAEARGVEDLETLAADFAGLAITVKREMEAGRDEVRVMTAHGAKGLEAPIVFLPETTLARGARGTPLMATADGGFLWCASGKADCEASGKARELRAKREEDEAYRLLYVALTRARDRLVLCGRVAANAKEENLKGWWGAITGAFAQAGVADEARRVTSNGMEILRFGPDPQRMTAAADAPRPTRAALPLWAGEAAAQEAYARYASPSQLGEGFVSPAASPLAETQGLGRFRRGDLIHRLLQILPDLPRTERWAAALRILGRERDLTDEQRQEMAAAALGVLEDPRFAEVFGPGSRAEVPVAGTAKGLPQGLAVSGRIDRLVVLPDRVLVADFKTNRPSPARIEDADPAYLTQMAVYAAVLADIFEGRRIEAALVWTDGPKLMAVPENLLAGRLAALHRNG